MKFDVADALLWLDNEDIPVLEGVVNELVCPVGYGGGVFAFVTPSGRMLFLHDEWLTLSITRSVEAGIEKICSRQFEDYELIELSNEQRPIRLRDS